MRILMLKDTPNNNRIDSGRECVIVKLEGFLLARDGVRPVA